MLSPSGKLLGTQVTLAGGEYWLPLFPDDLTARRLNIGLGMEVSTDPGVEAGRRKWRAQYVVGMAVNADIPAITPSAAAVTSCTDEQLYTAAAHILKLAKSVGALAPEFEKYDALIALPYS